MSLEFNAPPLSRRERRERELLLIAQGVPEERAAELATQTGVIELPGVPFTPAAAPEVPQPAVVPPVLPPASPPQTFIEPATPGSVIGAADGSAVPLTRRALRELAEAEAAAAALPSTSDPLSPSTQASIANTWAAEPLVPTTQPAPEPAGTEPPQAAVDPRTVFPAGVSAPIDLPFGGGGLTDSQSPAPAPVGDSESGIDLAAEPAAPHVDVEVIEVVEQLFSSEATALMNPSVIPPEPGSETGPIHWTDALSMPKNIDPTDPASTPHIPAIASDTNTIVLDEMPDLTTMPSQTGEIELMVTGTILLPTELTETGAPKDMLDSEHVEQNEDISDELPLSSLTPKSASAAVNASAETPAMISEPPKAQLSTGAIIALTAGGAAGVVLIALGVGALFHIF
ncbi:MAG: hypothetical protein ACKOXM_06400 [Agromyces sp.]